MKKCPYCAEQIQDEAIVCRYCGRDVAVQSPPDIQWKEFAQQFKTADRVVQGKLWADLTEDQRRHLKTNVGLVAPSLQSPPNKSMKILIGSIVGVFGILLLLAIFLGGKDIIDDLGAGAADPGFSVLGCLFFLAIPVACVVYALPTIIAVKRDHHQTATILVVNIFLGWTFLGWVVALAMSASSVKPRN